MMQKQFFSTRGLFRRNSVKTKPFHYALKVSDKRNVVLFSASSAGLLFASIIVVAKVLSSAQNALADHEPVFTVETFTNVDSFGDSSPMSVSTLHQEHSSHNTNMTSFQIDSNSIPLVAQDDSRMKVFSSNTNNHIVINSNESNQSINFEIQNTSTENPDTSGLQSSSHMQIYTNSQSEFIDLRREAAGETNIQ